MTSTQVTQGREKSEKGSSVDEPVLRACDRETASHRLAQQCSSYSCSGFLSEKLQVLVGSNVSVLN